MIIETERLILRGLAPEDAPSVFAYAKDPEVAKMVSWPPHQTIEDSLSFIDEAMLRQSKFPSDCLGIRFKEDPSTVIGTVNLRKQKNNHELEVAWALGRKYWRQGIMFEAAHTLINRGFQEQGIERIFATCDPENIASKSLMLKLGMKYEGCLRKRAFAKGRFYDLEYYSVLKDEWIFDAAH